MAFYQEQSGWGGPARQLSWEQQQASQPQQPQQPQSQQQAAQQAPPSRSGANSVTAREDALAFHSQIDDVDRAIDNLVKSGKFPFMTQNRRDSMPMGTGRPFVDFDPRTGPRHHSVSDFDGGRQSSGAQGFYQNQRYGPRNEADSMMQAKRRMAAQRERELRNYHQEQQYNRSVVADTSGGNKSERSYSPNTMNEDERRELIARQHRALYGDNSSLYSGDGTSSRPMSQDARVNTGMSGRGNSPLNFDQFGAQGGDGSAVQMPSRDQQSSSGKDQQQQQSGDRDNSTASPSSNQNTSYGLFDNAQHSSRTSNSSPTGGSPPRQGQKGGSGVAPIGTRPNAGQAALPNQALNKRSTTPLPSPLSYGFSASEQQGNAADRTASAASNQSGADKSVGLGGWGSNSGVWGNASSKLGVQASVWG